MASSELNFLLIVELGTKFSAFGKVSLNSLQTEKQVVCSKLQMAGFIYTIESP